ncbi:potassium transporter TrkG [Paenibacillus rhizoplanae]
MLLALPISSSSGLSIGWLAALFTSTSAVCVTGLVVLDTGTDFFSFWTDDHLTSDSNWRIGIYDIQCFDCRDHGEKKIGLKERLLIQQSSNSVTTQGVVRLSLNIFLISFIVETTGAIVLALRWAHELGTTRSIYYGIFHSVSAFNNAGFGLWPDSLSRYVGDPLVNIVISFFVYHRRDWIHGDSGSVPEKKMESSLLSYKKNSFNYLWAPLYGRVFLVIFLRLNSLTRKHSVLSHGVKELGRHIFRVLLPGQPALIPSILEQCSRLHNFFHDFS